MAIDSASQNGKRESVQTVIERLAMGSYEGFVIGNVITPDPEKGEDWDKMRLSPGRKYSVLQVRGVSKDMGLLEIVNDIGTKRTYSSTYFVISHNILPSS